MAYVSNGPANDGKNFKLIILFRTESFFIDGIRDVEWNADPFSTLVLPDGYKDLVLSFVEAHVGGDQPFGDVVSGKGMFYENSAYKQ